MIYKPINFIHKKTQQIQFLKEEISHKRIEEQLNNSYIQNQINQFKELIEKDICVSIPNAFWKRKQHCHKARPIQMNVELLQYCHKEIQELMQKRLIRPSKSPWS